MTTQDLIIGHFEGTLGSAESAELERLLSSSADVRSAFERQKAIEAELVEDAERLVAPNALREATLAAALGTAVHTIGGGIGAFLTTKIAAVVGTLLVGGLVVGSIVSNSDEQNQKNVAPGNTGTIDRVEEPTPAVAPEVEQAESPAAETSSSVQGRVQSEEKTTVTEVVNSEEKGTKSEDEVDEKSDDFNNPSQLNTLGDGESGTASIPNEPTISPE